VKFLVDAQLPPSLARWLREAGHEAEHVEDVGLREANDGAIWAHALRSGAVLVTKDEDFAARSALTAITPMIVWLRIGNTTNRALLTWIEPRLPGIAGLLAQGRCCHRAREPSRLGTILFSLPRAGSLPGVLAVPAREVIRVVEAALPGGFGDRR